MAFKLREYQEQSATDAIDCLINRGLTFCLCLPAQTGKTNTVFEIIRRFIGIYGTKFTTLFVTPRKFITKQGAEEAENFFPFHKIGYINSTLNTEKKLFSQVNSKYVVVADLKTIINRLEKHPNLKSYFNLLVIDEAHYSDKQVERLRKLLSHCYQMGVTATPHDEKGKYIDSFQVIYDKFNTAYMVEKGYLAETIVYQASLFVTHQREYQAYEKSLNYGADGEITSNSLAKATNSKAGKILTEAMIRETLSKGILRRGTRALVYTGSIEQSEKVVDTYRRYGLRAVTVHSKVKNPLELIDRFNRGEFDILVSVDMLIMGVVIKNVKKSLFYRDIGSWITYIQVWNRGRGGSREQTRIPNELYFFTKAYAKKGHADDFRPHYGDTPKKKTPICKKCGVDTKQYPPKIVSESVDKGYYFIKKECIVCGYQTESQRSTQKSEVYDGTFDMVRVNRAKIIKGAIVERIKLNLRGKAQQRDIDKIGAIIEKLIPQKSNEWLKKIVKVSEIKGRDREVMEAIIKFIKK